MITVAQVPLYGKIEAGTRPSIKQKQVKPTKLTINYKRLEEPSNVYGKIKQPNK